MTRLRSSSMALLCPYESGNNETICAASLPIVVFNMLSRANNSTLGPHCPKPHMIEEKQSQ